MKIILHSLISLFYHLNIFKSCRAPKILVNLQNKNSK